MSIEVITFKLGEDNTIQWKQIRFPGHLCDKFEVLLGNSRSLFTSLQEDKIVMLLSMMVLCCIGREKIRNLSPDQTRGKIMMVLCCLGREQIRNLSPDQIRGKILFRASKHFFTSVLGNFSLKCNNVFKGVPLYFIFFQKRQFLVPNIIMYLFTRLKLF